MAHCPWTVLFFFLGLIIVWNIKPKWYNNYNIYHLWIINEISTMFSFKNQCRLRGLRQLDKSWSIEWLLGPFIFSSSLFNYNQLLMFALRCFSIEKSMRCFVLRCELFKWLQVQMHTAARLSINTYSFREVLYKIIYRYEQIVSKCHSYLCFSCFEDIDANVIIKTKS